MSNRLRTLRYTAKYLDPGFRTIYVNSIFRSKLLFGMETWGGCKKSFLDKIQSLQDQAAKIALSGRHYKLSVSQIQDLLHWLNICQEIDFVTYKISHYVANFNIPEELQTQMPLNTTGHGIQAQGKFGVKPRWLNKKLLFRNSLRSRMYKYNSLPSVITMLESKNKFKTELRKFMLHNRK